jgi:Bacterial Ig-like domain (group 2)
MIQKSSLSVALALVICHSRGLRELWQTDSTSSAPGYQSITISPASAQLELGTNQQFTATATLPDGGTQDVTQSVSWSSSDQSVVRVNATSGRVGLANTRGPGTATIRAFFNGISGSTSVTVTRRVSKFLYAAGIAGITGFSINPTTGVLTPLTSPPFTAVGSITSLAVTRDRKFLYAADFGAGVILGFRTDSSGSADSGT